MPWARNSSRCVSTALTREIRVPRIVGAFAAGRIMNPRTARSQLMGGMIWGISSALHEATEIDPRNARYVNDNLADYLMPVNADVDKVEVILVPEDRRQGQSGRRQGHGRARQCRHRGGGRQRGLSRHRQAHPPAADPDRESLFVSVANRNDAGHDEAQIKPGGDLGGQAESNRRPLECLHSFVTLVLSTTY